MVETSTSSGCHHPKRSYSSPKRFHWIHPKETPNIELPNDATKLFDVDDDVGTSTIADLSVPSEDEEEEVKSNNVWNIPLLSYLNFLHFTLIGKPQKMGQTSKHG